jgi:hypothetical protein
MVNFGLRRLQKYSPMIKTLFPKNSHVAFPHISHRITSVQNTPESNLIIAPTRYDQ